MSLRASGLACIRGDRRLFSGISFELDPGEVLRVSGANGSGKTSLLRMLCGLAVPAEGEVRWQGRDIRKARNEFSASLIYLGHASAVKDDLLAWENLVVASTLAGQSITREQAYAALDALDLDHAADLPARALSQGQRKRVALARLSLDTAAPLWILDEPFAALDRQAVDNLRGTIDRHLARGGIAVYTTHQEIELRARRAWCLDMDDGRLC